MSHPTELMSFEELDRYANDRLNHPWARELARDAIHRREQEHEFLRYSSVIPYQSRRKEIYGDNGS